MTGKEVFFKEAMELGIDTADIEVLFNAMLGCYFPERYGSKKLSLVDDDFIKVVFLYNKFGIGMKKFYYPGGDAPTIYTVIKL